MGIGGDKMTQEKTGRNIYDTAMDLLNIHISLKGLADEEELKKVFTEYYALAKRLGEKNGINLKGFIPEEINNKLTE